MIAILSPAKNLKEYRTDFGQSQPQLLNRTAELMPILKQLTANDLKKLMKISDNLANLNVERYYNFSDKQNLTNASQALFAFNGAVYQGLDAMSLSEEEVLYAQNHVNILSGLYGLLKPLDLIQPYRLEMGTKLQNDLGNDLYKFWGNTITEALNANLKSIKSEIVVNLASDEYFKAINKKNINGTIIKIVFKEFRGDQLKFITYNSKKARGLMTRFMIKNKIENVEDLKGFDYEGYYFYPDNSKENELWFVK